MAKRIALLGSTGSIGRQTLEVVGDSGGSLSIVALTAGSNIRLLEQQVRRFKPELAVLKEREDAAALKRSLGALDCRVESSSEGLVKAARWPTADLVVNALVGFSGFIPTLEALQGGKTVALANKEALVVGGELLERSGLLDPERILPLDSEHSAIRQALGGTPISHVSRIWLTASGGPFRDWDEESLARATPSEALAHPNWKMGPKITVDSATLMNKGFEVIEAHWLFGLPLHRIEVLIHPQSIIHSAVEFIDGSVIAQLGPPDMRLPIQYALSYPERKTNSYPRLNLLGQELTFSAPDRKRFPCLELAYRAMERGGTAPACLNAANEVAVEQFLKGSIGFQDIPGLIARVMDAHTVILKPERNDLEKADGWARRYIRTLLAGPTKRS